MLPFGLWGDMVLDCLWRLTEESFWLHVFGDRLFNLLKRYFGNDVVLCGMLFYITRKSVSIKYEGRLSNVA
jgi:hypothetical protein